MTPSFTGLEGRLLGMLLQIPGVRFNRLQRGFVEQPAEYRRFLVEVVGARIATTPGRIGLFGCGEHTRVMLDALPGLAARMTLLTDNNRSLWRQTRFGRPVLPPDEAVTACDAFVLSTAVFQHLLRQDLRRRGFRGPVIAVDDDVPPAWFLGGVRRG